MVVIVGLIVLGAAVIVGVVGLLANAGPTHQLTDPFTLFGYDVTGATGTLFLVGIAVGAVAALGLGVLLAGAVRTAERGREARRQLARSQRETAFINRGHVSRPTTTSSAVPEPRSGVLGRWRGRQPTKTRVDQSW